MEDVHMYIHAWMYMEDVHMYGWMYMEDVWVMLTLLCRLELISPLMVLQLHSLNSKNT